MHYIDFYFPGIFVLLHCILPDVLKHQFPFLLILRISKCLKSDYVLFLSYSNLGVTLPFLFLACYYRSQGKNSKVDADLGRSFSLWCN